MNIKKNKKFWKKRAELFQEKCDDLQHKYDMLDINFTAFQENVQQQEEMFKEQKLLKEQLVKRVRDLKFLNDKYKKANLNLQMKLTDLKDEHDTLKDCSDAEVERFEDKEAEWDCHLADIRKAVKLLNEDVKELNLPKGSMVSLRMKWLMNSL